ncbi:MAG: phosphatidate cytidylyltransferase [Candidatus Eisenbacteria bacterium]|uniref:Phosphatidate cytidylyltransferase n=1 Tax=Eiseniibacteriota bacterium TaxID=2212470 RepID=A0A849SN90_UNCEI|nr:phosphatidate cytidylyltransferase [Candidatus Eisenbacteria bacterium]
MTATPPELAPPEPMAIEPAAAAGEAPKRSSWALPLRIASGVLFVPLLLFLNQLGGFAFFTLVALVVAAGLIEFYTMMRGRELRPYRRLGLASALALLWVCAHPETPYVTFLATSGVLLVLALELRRPEATRRIEDIAVTWFGVLYVGWLSAHLVLLRELPWQSGLPYADGARFVALAFALTWSCDIGAFAVGRALGRTRPWSRISPRKSLEGAAGGLTAAALAAFACRATFAPFLSWLDALALGLLAGVFSQVGDLVESLLKRDARFGDSSELIPGHGGVLDRFDSLFFAAPVVYYYLRLVVFGLP